MKQILGLLFLVATLCSSGSARIYEIDSIEPLHSNYSNDAKITTSEKVTEIRIFESDNNFLYQIVLSCTVLVYYQYTTDLGILMDLISTNPALWLGQLDSYYCPPTPPPSEPYLYA